MADNVTVDNGTGTDYGVATDDVGGVHFQRVKLDLGGDGVSSPVVDLLPTTSRAGAERFTEATLDALNEAISMPTAGAVGVVFSCSADATLSGTVRLEASFDGGSTWVQHRGLAGHLGGGRLGSPPDVDGGDLTAGNYILAWSLNNINDLYVTDLRVRVSAYTSGSVAFRATALQSVIWNQDGTPAQRVVGLDNEALDVDNIGFSDGVDLPASNRVLATQGPSFVFNGTNWDRLRGDVTNGVDVDVTRLPVLPAGNNNIGDVDVLTVPAPLSTTGNGEAASAQRVTLASDSTGQVTIAASDNNIGNVDVVTSALPTGAATSAKQDTLIGHVDGIEGLLTTIDADTGALAGTVSGSELQVDVVSMPNVTIGAALPAGTNAIGKLSANSGVDIGDVDVTSLPALPAGTNNIGDVDVLTLPSIPAGTNNIGDVDVLTLPGVAGTAAHASPTSGNPVFIAGRASAAIPTDVGADGDAAGMWTNRNGAQVVSTAPHVGLNSDPWNLVHEGAQYTSAQTSTILVDAAAGEKIVVTKVQIQSYGTTAGTAILYFGTGAYSRGTSRAVFDGEFAPSATSKPGVVMDGPFIAGTNGDDLRVTTTNALSITFSVWYYVIT